MNHRLRRILSLEDFEAPARRYLPRPLSGYVAGATERNSALTGARDAFADYVFVPRTLVDVSKRTMETELFGIAYAAPFGLAPMGASALMAYRGDLVLAEAAQAARVPMIMSGMSLIPLETVAKAAPGTWFQIYVPGDRDRIAALVDRVAAAGFKTLVLTVDVPVLGSRENNIRNGFSAPLRPSLRLVWDGITHPFWLYETAFRTLRHHGMPHFENATAVRGPSILSRTVERDFNRRDTLDWSHVEFIRKRWTGRFVLKGLLSAADARLAREHGADAIVVSNHGGRQLDGAIAPLHVLPEIVAAVGNMPVILDGGIRRGTDVLKALALGARMVLVGRPFLYAAALAGEAGVAHAIRLLAEGVHRDMALLGAETLSALNPDVVRRR